MRMWVMRAHAAAEHPAACLPNWLRVFPLEGEVGPGDAAAPALTFDCGAPGTAAGATNRGTLALRAAPSHGRPPCALPARVQAWPDPY